ncbi:MAG: hypothetical protein ACLS4Z_03760 [Christensenellaceae bacterium]
MNIEDLKNAIEDEADFYDEDDENERIARYSGKWVICRVVTVSDKNADELPAEGAARRPLLSFTLPTGKNCSPVRSTRPTTAP